MHWLLYLHPHIQSITWQQTKNLRAQKTKIAEIREKLWFFSLDVDIMKQSTANLTGKYVAIYHRCCLNVTCLTSGILYALTSRCHWGPLVCSFPAGLNWVEENTISTRFNRNAEFKITVVFFLTLSELLDIWPVDFLRFSPCRTNWNCTDLHQFRLFLAFVNDFFVHYKSAVFLHSQI